MKIRSVANVSFYSVEVISDSYFNRFRLNHRRESLRKIATILIERLSLQPLNETFHEQTLVDKVLGSG